MAIESFKPTLWSDAIIADVSKALVYGNVANRSFEGVVRYGNSVKLNEIGDISVSDYTQSGGVSWEDIDDAVRELQIDQQKYFSFAIDDIDRVQAKPEVMNNARRKAAHALADAADQYLASLYDEAGAKDGTNLGTSSSHKTIYAKNMPEIITHAHRVLDEKSAPRQNRWMIVPPWVAQYLVYSHIANGIGFDDPNSGAMNNGFVDSGMGFSYYMSNNVSNDGTEYRIMFGTPDALAFVGQVQTIEAVRREDYFADGVRGLYVYGAKAMRPDHLGVAILEASGVTT